MKDLPAGFEELAPGHSTSKGGMFIYLSPFAVKSSTGYNATVSRELFTALGEPARVAVAVNPDNGQIIIRADAAGKFKVHNSVKFPRLSASSLVKAGVPIKTRIYFTGQDGVYVSEATK